MACSGETRRGLALELDQLRTMARELEEHVCRGSPAARELCGALAASVDRAIVHFGSCSPEPAAGDSLVNAGKSTTGRFKKRKGMSEVRRQVRVRSVQDVAPLDDGLGWRKYGQKDILGAKYPRAYFRCTHRHTQGCHATKQVQRADGDPLLFDVVYLGEHTCAAHRVGDGDGARRPPSAEQPAAGQEELQSSPLAAGTAGIHQWLEPMTPSSFLSSPGCAGTGSGIFNCCFPLASPASSECQISSGYDSAARGFEVAMDFEAQLDEWLLNPSEFFQPEEPVETETHAASHRY